MKIFVHVDADPDFSAFLSKFHRQRNPKYFEWRSLTSTIRFFETFSEKMKNVGFKFKTTFFLRADEQIRAVYGEFSEIFTKFCDEIKNSFSVGWHPHLLRWYAASKCWHQEFKDNDWIVKTLTDCYDHLESRGFQVRYSKMGWCFHNNSSMKTLSHLGIEADFSALPGSQAPGRQIGSLSFQDRYDWSKTKPQPYHPNERDYQISGTLGIIEIPLTTYEISGVREFLYTMKLALPSYRRFDFSYTPSFRRMVPVFLPNLVKLQNLNDLCEVLVHGDTDYMTLYLHPSDLLKPNAQAVLENFILHTISAADRHGVKTSFADAAELSSLYASAG